jgi:hypothetical protein
MRHLRKYNESSDSREKLDFSDVPKSDLIYTALYGDGVINHNGEIYEFVKKDQTYFDGEKGYVQYHVIIQRESDGKYFKGFAEDWGRGEREVDTKFVEVFKKEKITYYYE